MDQNLSGHCLGALVFLTATGCRGSSSWGLQGAEERETGKGTGGLGLRGALHEVGIVVDTAPLGVLEAGSVLGCKAKLGGGGHQGLLIPLPQVTGGWRSCLLIGWVWAEFIFYLPVLPSSGIVCIPCTPGTHG